MSESHDQPGPAVLAREFYNRYLLKTAVRTIVWVLLGYTLVYFFPTLYWIRYLVLAFIAISIVIALISLIAAYNLERREREKVTQEKDLSRRNTNMENELIICIPGPWDDSRETAEAIITTTAGKYIFAGEKLFCPSAKDHIEMEIDDPADNLEIAFRLAGQGKITDGTLEKIAYHKSIAYLHFPLDIIEQRSRLKDFTEVIARAGGMAIKLESSGIAHDWDRWFTLIGSENLFDTYCASVVLVGDEQNYYSCGMHIFGLPEAQVSNSTPIDEAADLLNRFNIWQILERPEMESGHTFSLTEESQYFELELIRDERHPEDELFHNPQGIWNLAAVE
jgi:Domain of unknown function (DUF4261)